MAMLNNQMVYRSDVPSELTVGPCEMSWSSEDLVPPRTGNFFRVYLHLVEVRISGSIYVFLLFCVSQKFRKSCDFCTMFVDFLFFRKSCDFFWWFFVDVYWRSTWGPGAIPRSSLNCSGVPLPWVPARGPGWPQGMMAWDDEPSPLEAGGSKSAAEYHILETIILYDTYIWFKNTIDTIGSVHSCSKANLPNWKRAVWAATCWCFGMEAS